MDTNRAASPAQVAAATTEARIHVVDDDSQVRTAITRLLRSRGYLVQAYTSAEEFLATHDPDEHGCIILDVTMEGLDGLALQQMLVDGGETLPIIFLTGCADVPICAAAMRKGAVDFLTKPVDEAALVRAITIALANDAARREAHERRIATQGRLDTLTPREREVLSHVMDGRLNKQIAADLGTAEKTVKVHRARAMEKMHVRSVAELVRMVERASGFGPLT